MRNKHLVFLALSAGLLFWSGVGQPLAAVTGLFQTGSPGTVGLSETKSLLATVFNVVMALGLVVVLLYAFVYLLKKIGLGQGSSAGSMIKVLETKMVAPKKYIAIVEIADKILSVGITEQSINLLTELDVECAKKIRSSVVCSSPAKMSGTFASILNKVTGRNLPMDGHYDV